MCVCVFLGCERVSAKDMITALPARACVPFSHAVRVQTTAVATSAAHRHISRSPAPPPSLCHADGVPRSARVPPLPVPRSSHLSFRPKPVLRLGDETVGDGFAPDKQVIKDSIHPNDDPLDNYFGF
jgi:hypothetical protein